MKHKLNFLPVLFLFAILSFTSCSSFEKDTEAVVEEFFEAYNNQDYDKITSITYENNSLFADIMKETINEDYGEIESFTKYNSYKPAKYDNKGMSFFYKCKFKKTKEDIYCIIDIAEEDNEYIVIGINFDTDKDWIDSKHIYIANASTTVIEYYASLRNDIDGISKFLHKEKIIDAGFEDDFINMLHEKREYYGKIISTSKLQNSTYNLKDGTHVIEIYTECKTDSFTFYERIDLIKSKDGFKINDLAASKDLDKLE